MFSTYILKSETDNKYYYGLAENVERRLSEHNAGKVIATKNRKPLKLHYTESFKTKKEALKREMFFKKRSGYKWLKENNII